ncbi:TPA: hypothetical protein ACGO8N_002234 [Streptococcus suis]
MTKIYLDIIINKNGLFYKNRRKVAYGNGIVNEVGRMSNFFAILKVVKCFDTEMVIYWRFFCRSGKEERSGNDTLGVGNLVERAFVNRRFL